VISKISRLKVEVPERHPGHRRRRHTITPSATFCIRVYIAGPGRAQRRGFVGVVQPLLAQWRYSICRGRLLIQQLEYDLLFRWIVGISASIGVWNCAVFSKNRECLMAGDIVLVMFLSTLELTVDARRPAPAS
jgi:hypothetical protein